MIRTVFALAFCVLACSAFAENGQPTPADNTTSVLATNGQPTPAVAEPAPADNSAACQETAREVRLGRFQARRLERQADRQEARAACECCKCGCQKKDCRPTALVVTRSKPSCKCGCDCK